MTISLFISAHSGPRRLVDPVRPSSRSISFETAVRGKYILTRSSPNDQCLVDDDLHIHFPTLRKVSR